jgi:hypothetical protein
VARARPANRSPLQTLKTASKDINMITSFTVATLLAAILAAMALKLFIGIVQNTLSGAISAATQFWFAHKPNGGNDNV